MLTIVLLLISNVFMTFAWYGHLKHRSAPVVLAIVFSWLIAFGEYCFQVPANRIGYGQFTAYQLKIIQESITLVVFAVFAYFIPGRVDAVAACGVVHVPAERRDVCLLGAAVTGLVTSQPPRLTPERAARS